MKKDDPTCKACNGWGTRIYAQLEKKEEPICDVCGGLGRMVVELTALDVAELLDGTPDKLDS